MESHRVSEALRVVVAVRDDAQRDALASLLTSFEDVDVVGRDKDGRRALSKMNQAWPDLVFLDRGMLTLRELQAVRKALERGSPLIAFVMTRPQPVDAFEPNAIDYLLLPATSDRARVTLDRAKERLDAGSFTVLPSPPEASVPSGEPLSRAMFLQRVPVRTRDGFRIIPVEELVSVVAHGEYMHLTTTDGERHVITYRLKDLEARLNPARFIRLSRSILVNIDFVRRVAPARSGLLTVALANGDEYRASRLRARELREWLLRL
jgi:two-component system LytT family response regulator